MGSDVSQQPGLESHGLQSVGAEYDECMQLQAITVALDVSAFERLAESSPPQVGNCAEVIYDVRGGRAVIESFPNFWNARKAAELLDVADEAVRGVDGVETVRGWREIYSVTDGVTEE